MPRVAADALIHRRDMPLDAPVDAQGRVDAARLPLLDEHTILCLQAGEVNTGAFDPFDPIIPRAKKVEAWVHVDGAFGLWARASSLAHLTQGIELADSWTTDAHKWLNTPYDCAMTICRNAGALAQAMNSDAAYSSASAPHWRRSGTDDPPCASVYRPGARGTRTLMYCWPCWHG